MITTNGHKYYTGGELAKELGIHPMTIYRWRKENLLPFYKLPIHPKLFYYRKEDILKLTKQKEQETT